MKLAQDLKHIFHHTQGVWEKLHGCTILITGGTGFFGKWILDSFLFANEALSLNAKMIVLSRDPHSFLAQNQSYNHSNITFLKGDVRTFEFPGEPIDYIIHAAVEINAELNKAQPLLMYETIVDGCKHMLELARVKKVKAILHTSSGSVYGKQPHTVSHIPEDYSGSPDIFDKAASLGEGKRVSEMLCNIYHNAYGVNSKIARCFSFVGPHIHLDAHFAMGNFIKNVLSGSNITINGDGTPYRSYLYASDLMIWLWNILIFGETCRPYNVGSDQAVSIEELAVEVASFSKKTIKIEVSQPKSNIPPIRYIPDVTRAKKELNLSIFVGLHEGIKKTIEFYS